MMQRSARTLAHVLLPALFAHSGLAAAASAAELKLESREYKLMLKPAGFIGSEPDKAVRTFWDQQLKPIIAERLDRRKNGKTRDKESFERKGQRTIVYKETEACLLNNTGYIVRERQDLLKDGRPDPKEREVTLKFRTPDRALAAALRIEPNAGKAETKFEEDIAPQIDHAADGTKIPRFKSPPGMRSMFSVSSTQTLRANEAITSLRDLAARYRGFESSLRKAGLAAMPLDSPLVSGQVFRDRVYRIGLVDLGDTDAKVDLTLWYKAGTSAPGALELAELSFKFDTEDGKVSGGVAQRALSLFGALQELPEKWTSPEQQTKTSTALPEHCKQKQ
jgi:hypothetical protein